MILGSGSDVEIEICFCSEWWSALKSIVLVSK